MLEALHLNHALNRCVFSLGNAMDGHKSTYLTKMKRKENHGCVTFW